MPGRRAGVVWACNFERTLVGRVRSLLLYIFMFSLVTRVLQNVYYASDISKKQGGLT